MEIKKPILHLIVKVDKSHIEEYDVKGVDNTNLVRSHLYNDADNANKEGVVVATPKWSNIKAGDTVYFHHSIVEWRTGGNVSESYCIDKEEGLYRIPYAPVDYGDPLYNKVYAHKDSDGVIQSVNGWVLLKQVREDFKQTSSGLFLVESIEDTVYASGEVKPKKNFGEVVYTNEHLESTLGLCQGDVVIHKPDGEYPIVIDGETLWRVWDSFILSHDKENLLAVGDNVIVLEDTFKGKTEGGVILKDDFNSYSTAKVVSVSANASFNNAGLNVHSKIFYPKGAAKAIEINGAEYKYIDLRKIWGIISE